MHRAVLLFALAGHLWAVINITARRPPDAERAGFQVGSRLQWKGARGHSQELAASAGLGVGSGGLSGIGQEDGSGDRQAQFRPVGGRNPAGERNRDGATTTHQGNRHCPGPTGLNRLRRSLEADASPKSWSGRAQDASDAESSRLGSQWPQPYVEGQGQPWGCVLDASRGQLPVASLLEPQLGESIRARSSGERNRQPEKPREPLSESPIRQRRFPRASRWKPSQTGKLAVSQFESHVSFRLIFDCPGKHKLSQSNHSFPFCWRTWTFRASNFA